MKQTRDTTPTPGIRMKTFACLAISWILVVSVSHAQEPAALKQMDDELHNQKVKFRSSIDECQKFALAGFDREIAAVKASKTSAAVKLERVGKIQAARDEFEKNGAWPEGEEYFKLQYDFAANLYRTYTPVSKAYEKLFGACLKANNLELANAYKKDKAEFDDQLPGRANIKEGAKFKGERILLTGKGRMEIRLVIGNVTESTIEARYEPDANKPGHTILQMVGPIDGIKMTITGTKAIRGPEPKGFVLTGFVIGDRIMLSKTSTNQGKVEVVFYGFKLDK